MALITLFWRGTQFKKFHFVIHPHGRQHSFWNWQNNWPLISWFHCSALFCCYVEFIHQTKGSTLWPLYCLEDFWGGSLWRQITYSLHGRNVYDQFTQPLIGSKFKVGLRWCIEERSTKHSRFLNKRRNFLNNPEFWFTFTAI